MRFARIRRQTRPNWDPRLGALWRESHAVQPLCVPGRARIPRSLHRPRPRRAVALCELLPDWLSATKNRLAKLRNDMDAAGCQRRAANRPRTRRSTSPALCEIMAGLIRGGDRASAREPGNSAGRSLLDAHCALGRSLLRLILPRKRSIRSSTHPIGTVGRALHRISNAKHFGWHRDGGVPTVSFVLSALSPFPAITARLN